MNPHDRPHSGEELCPPESRCAHCWPEPSPAPRDPNYCPKCKELGYCRCERASNE